MMMSRRKTLAILGGGTILAATAALGSVALRQPRTAGLPWQTAGDEAEPRRRALSFALLAPNPHNRQPWMVDLTEPGVVTLYADTTRLLPETDPFNRQITIGLGAFLDLMHIAASHDGHRVDITPFPDGDRPEGLDKRPIARAVFTPDPGVGPDPLFAHVLDRRSNKQPFDTARTVPDTMLATLSAPLPSGTRFGGSVAEQDVNDLRTLTHEALRIEIETPRTYKESVDLFRIGRKEVDASPDGIDFTGPLFETLHATGLFNRATVLDTTSQAYKAGLEAVYANADTAMGHVWLTTPTNTRADQLATGAAWLRLNLAATGQGLGVQPLSQALQEYPEMAELFKQVHTRLAPSGGTVQMLARIGFGPAVPPSPRWPLDTRIVHA